MKSSYNITERTNDCKLNTYLHFYVSITIYDVIHFWQFKRYWLCAAN